MNIAAGRNLKIGILGGGQLGRMLVQAAMNYGFDIHILDNNVKCPCKIFKNFHLGSITNFDDVYNFGKNMDIITIEIENVNTQALQRLELEGKRVYPGANIIELIKDKAKQKHFYRQHNIPTSAYLQIPEHKDILNFSGPFPIVQKAQISGYDGKGVFIIKNSQDLQNCIKAPCILEEMVSINKELGIIAVRNIDGNTTTYPPTHMYFDGRANLLEALSCPADISEQLADEIKSITTKIGDLLGIVGVFAIEFFLTTQGRLLVNELSPRVHNSGHNTKDVFISSQFDQHIRAISGLPTGHFKSLVKYSGLVNILGANSYEGSPNYSALYDVKDESLQITLYGKNTTAPNRKLGHITIASESYDDLMLKIKQLLPLSKIKT